MARRPPTTEPPPAALTDPLGRLRASLRQAALMLAGDATLSDLRLERPPRPDLGDYSTNAAMLLAPALGGPPRDAAQRLGEVLAEQLGDELERTEVAGPGFLNLFMSSGWYRAALGEMVAAGDRFGAGVPAPAERMLVEFVSANPTGPITVASGRHAAYGDALCRILAFAGHDVEREYYVNDHGSQVLLFGESIGARARGAEPPEDGYRGSYVAQLADRIEDAAKRDAGELAVVGVELMVADVRATLERFRVSFDRFYSERSLYDDGGLERAVDRLDDHDCLYESEGARWLRTTAFGDDKDRVVTRSSGEPTYLASDIAYHADKLARGFDRAIDVLGADHHGYVGRLRAAWEALGGDPGRLELQIMQLVNLLEGGERAQMSKRKGEFVTLDELIDDLGVDAARYFLLQRNHDTTLDLDLALAREQSQENPVYYVQYAHARIASILRKAGEEGAAATPADELSRSTEDPHPSARALVKRLLELPLEVEAAAARRAPHRLTTYAQEVAQGFSAFYRDCRVIGAAEEGGDEGLRLAICQQAGRVIARSLSLLGVAAPERM
ncbi:MAG: arginine--tRNA ligase [Thermoleophilaceae bacterium]|jgi:arginyl-tRNA synthetase|nr:arginine--tRNA ligase [Thermoleophilaceae bacterium]